MAAGRTEEHEMSNELPKIRGLMKMRNEAHILKDTLDNWAPFCTAGIYIYDDVSTDKSVEIARAHPAVKEVIQGEIWDPDREKAEWVNRQMVLARAQQFSGPNDWFVYFDADEHIYNFEHYELFSSDHVGAIACRLYDFYITPEDVDKPYNKREWIGPEFRTIPFFFRNWSGARYERPDQRIVNLPPGIEIPIHGDIKHYGKGFSVEQWEHTCDYYIKFWPKYSDKWRQRKGKAIHKDMLSDFGNPLIKWTDRARGFSLEDKPYGLR
jgi:glycosyltransferase involved in cell wall biosynthesis